MMQSPKSLTIRETNHPLFSTREIQESSGNPEDRRISSQAAYKKAAKAARPARPPAAALAAAPVKAGGAVVVAGAVPVGYTTIGVVALEDGYGAAAEDGTTGGV
jgi:hypothetical protein